MRQNKLVIKKLQSSDLSWFQVCRSTGITKSKQFGINIDSYIVKEIFTNSEMESSDIEIYTTYDTGVEMIEEVFLLSFRSKNWRITGKVIGEKYRELSPGDYIILYFEWVDNICKLYFEVVPRLIKAYNQLFNQINNNFSKNKILQGDEDELVCIRELLKPLNESLHSKLIRKEPSSQMKKVLSSRHILSNILSTVVTLSSKTQLDYLKVLGILVDEIRDIIKDEIISIKTDHKDTWRNVKKEKFGFVDGGVASIGSLGSEPIAIRVGQYSVTPGVEGEGREDFSFETQLVDELYDFDGNDALFEDFSEDSSKLRDMARIFSEAGTVYKSLFEENKFNYLYLHGPLVNPVAPYDECPSFTDKMINSFGITEEKLKTFMRERNLQNENVKHFIASYYFVLDNIFNSKIPVIGVIERSAGSRLISEMLFARLGNSNITQKYIGIMKDYKISDSVLFACVLQEGEYIRPFEVNKNGIHKAPNHWKSVISLYPKPISTYIKVTDTSFPFRIELYPGREEIQKLLTVTYHMARLLPHYAFPVGLDIADKFAKIPAWMSKQISKEQSSYMLQQALNSGRKDVIDFIKLNLTGNTRDWLFRPKF